MEGQNKIEGAVDVKRCDWQAAKGNWLPPLHENTACVGTLWHQTQPTARNDTGLRCENQFERKLQNVRTVHLPFSHKHRLQALI